MHKNLIQKYLKTLSKQLQSEINQQINECLLTGISFENIWKSIKSSFNNNEMSYFEKEENREFNNNSNSNNNNNNNNNSIESNQPYSNNIIKQKDLTFDYSSLSEYTSNNTSSDSIYNNQSNIINTKIYNKTERDTEHSRQLKINKIAQKEVETFNYKNYIEKKTKEIQENYIAINLQQIELEKKKISDKKQKQENENIINLKKEKDQLSKIEKLKQEEIKRLKHEALQKNIKIEKQKLKEKQIEIEQSRLKELENNKNIDYKIIQSVQKQNDTLFCLRNNEPNIEYENNRLLNIEKIITNCKTELKAKREKLTETELSLKSHKFIKSTTRIFKR